MEEGNKKNGLWLFVVLLFIFIVAASVMIWIFIKMPGNIPDATNADEVAKDEQDTQEAVEEIIVTKPVKFDFQPVVDEWVQSVGGTKSVMIYDLDADEVAGTYNLDEIYNTASLYKLFVVYEGYRRVQNGEWLADDPAGATGYSILECLDLAIRESYSPCAETLWSMIGHSQLDSIIKTDFTITDSDISSLSSNPNDIFKMMKIFYEHKDITDENLLVRMKDSFLVQPKTTYDWRQGLPKGFTRANVYNKVGWDYNPNGYWNIYHDAAIVEFPEQDRHFIVVVMSNLLDFMRIREFGTMLENAFLSA